jgi:hypothetical protein
MQTGAPKLCGVKTLPKLTLAAGKPKLLMPASGSVLHRAGTQGSHRASHECIRCQPAPWPQPIATTRTLTKPLSTPQDNRQTDSQLPAQEHTSLCAQQRAALAVLLDPDQRHNPNSASYFATTQAGQSESMGFRCHTLHALRNASLPPAKPGQHPSSQTQWVKRSRGAAPRVGAAQGIRAATAPSSQVKACHCAQHSTAAAPVPNVQGASQLDIRASHTAEQPDISTRHPFHTYCIDNALSVSEYCTIHAVLSLPKRKCPLIHTQQPCAHCRRCLRGW